MWLKKYGRKRVNPLAAFMTVGGVLLSFVCFDSGSIVLSTLSGVLFLGGIVFLDGFRLREIKRKAESAVRARMREA
jgi:hypothetical protein